MHIQINAADVQNSDALQDHARTQVQESLRHVAEQVTRVEVHLRNLSSHKGNASFGCTMEARLTHHQPLAVEHAADDLYKAIDLTANKLQRAVKHKLERLDRA